jgi:hypothetical protein
MRFFALTLAAAIAGSLLLAPTAHADNKAIATDEMEAYLEFVDYCGGVIFCGANSQRRVAQNGVDRCA